MKLRTAVSRKKVGLWGKYGSSVEDGCIAWSLVMDIAGDITREADCHP